MVAIETAALLLVAVAMAASLAQALAAPGRRQLDPAAYRAVQTAALPGIALGSLAEAAAVCAVLALLLVTPPHTPAFPWVAASMVALFGMNACYWLMARPAARLWWSPKASAATMSGGADRGGPWGRSGPDLRRLRDRWDRSHAVRAALALLSLGSLTAAVVLGPAP